MYQSFNNSIITVLQQDIVFLLLWFHRKRNDFKRNIFYNRTIYFLNYAEQFQFRKL
jgi:hypothetical protein